MIIPVNYFHIQWQGVLDSRPLQIILDETFLYNY